MQSRLASNADELQAQREKLKAKAARQKKLQAELQRLRARQERARRTHALCDLAAGAVIFAVQGRPERLKMLAEWAFEGLADEAAARRAENLAVLGLGAVDKDGGMG